MSGWIDRNKQFLYMALMVFTIAGCGGGGCGEEAEEEKKKTQQELQAQINAACASDIQKFCSAAGDDAAKNKCLKDHEVDIVPACKDAVNALNQ